MLIGMFACLLAGRAYVPVNRSLPAARAEKKDTASMLMESTNDTPEMAASPTFETISVSATPMSPVKTCSMTRGMRRARSSFLENKKKPSFPGRRPNRPYYSNLPADCKRGEGML